MAKNSNIHTISIFVANKPGVLVRCAQVFARRGYNIDSLVVSPGVDPKYSRMTITLSGDPKMLEQIIKQTNKLVDVLHCSEHTRKDAIAREYAMIKVKATSRNIPHIKSTLKNRAHILDQSDGAVIIGQTGTTNDLDILEDELKKKFDVVEMVRSGKLVMAKGKEAT